jgi:hypothetical protein
MIDFGFGIWDLGLEIENPVSLVPKCVLKADDYNGAIGGGSGD